MNEEELRTIQSLARNLQQLRRVSDRRAANVLGAALHTAGMAIETENDGSRTYLLIDDKESEFDMSFEGSGRNEQTMQGGSTGHKRARPSAPAYAVEELHQKHARLSMEAERAVISRDNIVKGSRAASRSQQMQGTILTSKGKYTMQALNLFIRKAPSDINRMVDRFNESTKNYLNEYSVMPKVIRTDQCTLEELLEAASQNYKMFLKYAGKQNREKMFRVIAVVAYQLNLSRAVDKGTSDDIFSKRFQKMNNVAESIVFRFMKSGKQLIRLAQILGPIVIYMTDVFPLYFLADTSFENFEYFCNNIPQSAIDRLKQFEIKCQFLPGIKDADKLHTSTFQPTTKERALQKRQLADQSLSDIGDSTIVH